MRHYKRVDPITKWYSKFEFANKGRLLARYEKVECLNLEKRFRIIYASDLHLRDKFSNYLCEEIVRNVKKEGPNLFLLGGDLVDSQQGFSQLRKLVEVISNQCMVGAVGGNHDDYVGRSLVKKVVAQAGGNWLEDHSMQIVLGRKTISILGDMSQSSKEHGCQILCSHYPDIFPEAVRDGIHVVFAGHLHGCQIVFSQIKNRLYPGAFFYRWNGLKFSIGESKMFVSRGISDTIPIRWNCPREIIVCDLH